MSEESHDNDQPASQDDARFEVKWTKKERAASSSSTPTTPDTGSLEHELAEERQRVSDLRDRWQRAAADLANLRKRTEQERGDMEKFASLRVVLDILPVLDNFERAITTIPGDLARLTWVHGIALIERHLHAILEREGLAPIEAEGKPFNPHEHEAIAEIESADVPPGTVVREYQRGYTLHGRVIRPTLVEIATEPAKPEPAEAKTTDEAQAENVSDEADTVNVGP